MTTKLIKVGHIDLSFHLASAAVVQAILEQAGHKVEQSAAPHEPMFERYGQGDVDFLVSAWLPDSHGKYLAPSLLHTRKLGVLYRPYCIWGVPDYVPEDAVASISDLLKPEVLNRMDRRIQGINPGAGISRFSRAMVESYGLSNAGYHFETGSEADCFDRFEEAVSRKEWVVIPLWHPQYLHHRYKIRELAEPKGLLGGVDEATLIVRQEAIDRIDQRALEALSQLELGNAVVAMLDYRIRKEGIDAVDAAKQWLADENFRLSA